MSKNHRGPRDTRPLLSFLMARKGTIAEREWFEQGGAQAQAELDTAHAAGLISVGARNDQSERTWTTTAAGVKRACGIDTNEEQAR